MGNETVNRGICSPARVYCLLSCRRDHLKAGNIAYFTHTGSGGFMSVATLLRGNGVLSIFWTLPIIGPMSSNVPPRFQCPSSVERNPRNMKRTYLAFVAAGLLACLTGGCASDCERHQGCQQCQQAGDQNDQQQGDQACQDGNGRGGLGCRGQGQAFQPGPPSGAVAYPYYTTRGPRDYFDQGPNGGIGP